MLNKLREHKHNKFGLRVLVVLLSIMILFGVLLNLNAFSTLPITMSFAFLAMILAALLAVALEYNGASFAAHFTVLALLVGNSIKDFRLIFGSSGAPFTILYMLLQAGIAVYAIIKLVAHKNELHSTNFEPSRLMSIALIYAMIGIYFRNGFDSLIVTLVVIATVVFTTRIKQVYLVLIYLFGIEITTNLTTIFINNSMPTGDLLLALLEIGISIVFIYYIVKDYKSTPYIENNERNSFFS